MSRTKTGDNWEVGSDDAPPALLAAAMMDGERLLWAKSLPSSHFVQLWLWFGAVSALFAILFFYFAPWGQSIAEYCVAHKGLSCRKFYLIVWPSAVCGVCLTVFGFHMAWKSKTSPWPIHYGISTDRAIRIAGNKPETIHSQKLDANTARQHMLGNVIFGKSKTVIGFAGLAPLDARHAIYWANTGRFRPEFQNGLSP